MKNVDKTKANLRLKASVGAGQVWANQVWANYYARLRAQGLRVKAEEVARKHAVAS